MFQCSGFLRKITHACSKAQDKGGGKTQDKRDSPNNGFQDPYDEVVCWAPAKGA